MAPKGKDPLQNLFRGVLEHSIQSLTTPAAAEKRKKKKKRKSQSQKKKKESSSSSSGTSESEEPKDEEDENIVSAIGMPAKQMQFDKKVSLLEHLTPYQLCFVLVGATPALSTFALGQCGGELLQIASRLTQQARLVHMDVALQWFILAWLLAVWLLCAASCT